jgi:hypothetical protein
MRLKIKKLVGVNADTVRKVIKKVGNMRVKIYAELEKI